MENKHGQRKHTNTKIVIEELHRAFKMFNENLFEGQLPEPAILIQSRGNKKLTLGWCTIEKVWKNDVTEEEKYEINIVAEALNRGIYPVMATLLHEMVHLHNLVNGIKDTSRGNTYHNMKFKNTAEAHGLVIEHADKIGWSVTSLQGSTMDLIDSYRFDEAVFSLGRKDFGEGDKPKKKKKTSSRKYICPECGTSIRASKDVLVLCGMCSDIENGKAVPMLKEPTEDDFETGDDAEKSMVEYVCLDCGCIHELPEGTEVCPDCGGELQKVEAVGTEEGKEVQPLPVIEEPTQLDDGAGNMIDVLQGKIDIEAPNEEIQASKINTGWDKSRIGEVIHEAYEVLPVPYNTLKIEISDRLVSQYATYKEGKMFKFSEAYLLEASDEEIIDTIKHQYVHHYQFVINGLKVNHKKEFKALCEKLGIKTTVPVKNHRAMI